jgi:type II secretory pathway pseudopilin PulG
MTSSTRCRGDAGMGMVEILISIMLLGIGSAAILTSMGTLARASDQHRQLVDVDAALVQAADSAIDDTALPYNGCATPAEYNAVLPRPTGWTNLALSITTVEYWNGTTFGATCYDDDTDVGSIARVQRITINAVNANGRGSHSLATVKRGS